MPRILVVAGPSGVGKGTILTEVKKRLAGHLDLTVSHTTRSPRNGEQKGKHYFFVTEKEFDKMKKKGKFLETANYLGNSYGTSWAEIHRVSGKANSVCLLEIELNGVSQLQRDPEMEDKAWYIFITAENMEALATRLKGRGTENEEEVQARLHRAAEEVELMKSMQCDLALINETGKVNEVVEAICNFVHEHYDLHDA